MEKINAREMALKIILKIEQEGAYANIALAKELTSRRVSEQDRRFITELTYGVVKSSATLDWILGYYVSRPIHKIPAPIHIVLQMGIYQILFLSKIPPSAACNEAVNLAKRYGHAGTVKFVNGVLRNVIRDPERAVYPDAGDRPAEFLALRYFHPQWLVERWLTRMSFEEAESLCAANNQTPPLSIRTNTLRISREDLLVRLERENVKAIPSEWVSDGILCLEHPALASIAALREGLFQVQDESSMIVGHVLDPQPGEFILDVCAAPGGKSTHIAALMNNQGLVVANELYEHKLALIQENAARLGCSIVKAVQGDALDAGQRYEGQADRVLVDAPCSGTGVLRRKPDSRWRKSPSIIKELSVLQKQILQSAAKAVKNGGTLVYSTCSIEPEENRNVVEIFLKEHPEFSLSDISLNHGNDVNDSKTIQLMPHKDNLDGFFIAKMKKTR